ncbi:MAG: serine/threonine protein kinase [Myxococcales bacterium]|nr:serine/threonine protein kinase [Myxococcales bacterium]
MDENQVVALVHGRLTGAPLREVQEHLDNCLDCLDLVGMFQQTTQDDTGDRGFVPLTESLQIDLNAPPGSKIGRYEVIRSLGRGGMGVVYLARDPELERAVALKLVRPSLQEDERANHFERRLVREAKAMAKLSHPNVLTIYDVGLHGAQVFLASEWIDGCTLDEWMANGTHRWRSIVKRFTSAARGLAAAHRAGLVHRDFKPSNVMLGKDDRVHVFDFGLVKATHSGVGDITTQLSGQFVVGTPAYMAPEQMTGKAADERSDQFSFCVALYEALAGRRPFSGRNITELLTNISAGQVAEPKKIPRWLCELLKRGMLRAPDDRHDSMRVIVDLLERGIQRSKRRSAAGLAAFGAAAALAASLGYWSGHSGSPAETDVAKPTGDVSGASLAQTLAPDLKRLDGLFEAHKHQDVVDGAAALMPRVGSHRPSETRLWAVSARASQALGRHQDAARSFEKGFYAAVAAGNDTMAALAAAEIVGLHATDLRDESGAARWESLAESAVERASSTQASATWLRIQGAAALAGGDVTTAHTKYSEAIRLLKSSEDSNGRPMALALEGLGATLAKRGERTEAKAKIQTALGIWREDFGASHPGAAFAQIRLADVLMQEGKLDEARILCEEALELLIAAYGDTHPRVAGVLNTLAEHAVAAGDAESANQALLRALRTKREAYGSTNPQLAPTLMNFAEVDRMRGRFGDAVIHASEAVELLEGSGAEGPHEARDLQRLQRARLALAEARLVLGQNAEALAACRSLHSHFEILGGADAVLCGRALACIGRALLAQEQTDQAMDELTRALKAFGDSQGPHFGLALFSVAKNNGNNVEALEQGRRAYDALSEAGPAWARETLEVEKWLERGRL